MKKLCLLCVVATLAFSIVGCQDYVCMFPEESLDGIYGRFWVNPNPIVFPIYDPEKEIFTAHVILSNIGSERLYVDSVEILSERYFQPLPEHIATGFSQNGWDGSAGCDKIFYMEFGFMLQPRDEKDARVTIGTLAINTSDPTSPTLEVPIIIDPNAEIPEVQQYNDVVCPVVKPNPIRFKKIQVGNTQYQDVCVRFEGGGLHAKITKLEVHGKGFFIQEATDHFSNEILLPIADYIIAQNSITVRISNRPASSRREGGTLLVQTSDDLGEERTLLVPVLDDL